MQDAPPASIGSFYIISIAILCNRRRHRLPREVPLIWWRRPLTPRTPRTGYTTAATYGYVTLQLVGLGARTGVVAVLAQVAWNVDPISVLWAVTVLGVLVCGILFLAFRD